MAGVADVSRDGFLATMDVSCWSFIRMAHLAEPLMTRGGSLFTMTYYGWRQRVVRNYNVIGIAKAALESSVRYLAAGTRYFFRASCDQRLVRIARTR